MSVSNLTVKQTYSGNGSNLDFAIPFTYFAETEVVVYVRDETVPLNPTLTLKVVGALQDYTLTGATPPSTPLSTTVTFKTAPTVAQKVIIYRALPLTQIVEYISSGRFPAESHEKALDRIVAMIQQMQEQLNRAMVMRIDEKVPLEPFTVPLPVGDTFWAWDASAEAIVYYTIAELDSLLAGGAGLNVPGGAAFALLEKASSTDGDAAWTAPVLYQGYSTRYSQLVDLSGAKATIDYIMNMGYAPPTASLGTSPSYSTLREKGDTIASVDLTATIVKVLDNIATVRFYRGATLLDTQVAGGGIPNGGASLYTDATPFSDTTTYSTQVDDASAQAKPSATSSRTFTFVYPYFDGADASGSLTAAQVAAKTKRIISTSSSITISFTAAASDYLYFAQPSSYTALTQILDVNNFDVTPSWDVSTGNYTALDASSQTLRVYRLINPVAAGTYSFTFKR